MNHKNFSQTTLAAAITDTGGVSITVSSSATFPAAPFIASIDTEAMLVTNVVTTSWTVTRGYEGSTAATHLNGATVYHDISAAEVDARVVGPASSVAGHLATFADTTGKVVQDGGVLSLYVAASDTLLNAFDAETTTTSVTYEKLKSIQVPTTGVFRTKFDMKEDGGPHVYGKIYVNGIAKGVQADNGYASYTTYNGGDFLVASGDTIELWGVLSSAGTGYYKNFRLYGTPTATPPAYVQV